MRLFMGLRRPRQPIAGSEFAGVVEAVGPAVTSFRVGDRVSGRQRRERRVCRSPRARCRRPRAVRPLVRGSRRRSRWVAARVDVPPTGVPLREKPVLVYGAGGSIGTAAVQLLAHHFGARVTAVCDTKDVHLVRSLGAQDVLDRFRDDFTNAGVTYDVVFDAVGRQSFGRLGRVLRPGGIFITVDLGFLFTCRCSRS